VTPLVTVNCYCIYVNQPVNDVATAAITWHPTALTEHGSLGSHPSLPLPPPYFVRCRAPRHIKPQASGTTSPGPLMLAYHRQIQYRVSTESRTVSPALSSSDDLARWGQACPDSRATPFCAARTSLPDIIILFWFCGYSTTWRNCFSFCFWFPSHFGR
jgi:hypothetical protein